MGIEPYVIHDRDQGTDRAEQFNEPIKVALGNDDKLFVLEECIEDTLGSDVPNSENHITLINLYKIIGLMTKEIMIIIEFRINGEKS